MLAWGNPKHYHNQDTIYKRVVSIPVLINGLNGVFYMSNFPISVLVYSTFSLRLVDNTIGFI